MSRQQTFKMLRSAIILAGSFGHAACSAENGASNTPLAESTRNAPTIAKQRQAQQTEGSMQIRMKTGAKTLTARLEDSKAARDFAALLPIELTLKDYASTEKIADLPRQLSTEGAPAGVDPEVGDIAYYAPWGNLAIYYRDFGYSRGLVRLGRIEADPETIKSLDGPVTIEAVE